MSLDHEASLRRNVRLGLLISRPLWGLEIKLQAHPSVWRYHKKKRLSPDVRVTHCSENIGRSEPSGAAVSADTLPVFQALAEGLQAVLLGQR